MQKNTNNKKDRDNAKRDINYAYDVIGRTRKHTDAFEHNMKNVFEQFVELADNYPVKLVAEQKDIICTTCPFRGKHCDIFDPSEYVSDQGGAEVDDSVYVYDSVYVEVFKYIAKKRKLKITTIEEIATFSDAEPQKTESILTTAGVVREVFQDRSFRRILGNKIAELSK